MENQLTPLELARQWKEHSPEALAIEEKHDGGVPLYSHEEMIETLAAYKAVSFPSKRTATRPDFLNSFQQ